MPVILEGSALLNKSSSSIMVFHRSPPNWLQTHWKYFISGNLSGIFLQSCFFFFLIAPHLEDLGKYCFCSKLLGKPKRINKYMNNQTPSGNVDFHCQNENWSWPDTFCSGALVSIPDLPSSPTIKRDCTRETLSIL